MQCTTSATPLIRSKVAIKLAKLFLLLGIGVCWFCNVPGNAEVVPTASHGKQELGKILLDRPEMKTVVGELRDVQQWICNRIDEGIGDGRIFWDSRPPYQSPEAEHEDWNGNVFIRITDSPVVESIDKWIMLIYGLENIRNIPDFRRLKQSAIEGRIGRDEYAKNLIELEFRALHRTYETLQKNDFIKHASASRLLRQFSNAPDSFSEY